MKPQITQITQITRISRVLVVKQETSGSRTFVTRATAHMTKAA